MKKVSIVFVILIFIIAIGVGGWFWFGGKQELVEPRPSGRSELEDLGSIILKNTKFKDFRSGIFSLKYPDWRALGVDPMGFWPKEIAEKEEILLYLTNPDGVIVIVTKRGLTTEEFAKPYPLIFRKVFKEIREIMEEKGGISDYQIIREEFFEMGLVLELSSVIFGKAMTSISKSILIVEADKKFIYSVGVSAEEKMFEDYRALANYIMETVSVQYRLDDTP